MFKQKTHLDVRTFKFRLQNSASAVASDVETIAMRVADQNIAGVADVDAVREACDLLASDAAFELSSLAEDGHAMSFEVANVEVVA